MSKHTLYKINVEITLHDEHTDPDSIIEQIADIDGVDVVISSQDVETEVVDV